MRTALTLIACLAAPGASWAFTTPPSSSSTSSSLHTSSSSLFAKFKVFIDGEAGTTGIQVFERLNKRDDLEVISIPDDKRKDVETRKKLINEADAVILCKFVCWVESIVSRCLGSRHST